MTVKWIDVAVGVLVREDGRVLLNSRPEGKPYAGYWEFPGGKVEEGETVHEALARELDEELGIELVESFPWFVLEHHYEHGDVRLHFRRARVFRNEPRAREGQALGFFAPGERTPGLLLPASEPIIARVDLPDVWEDSTDILTLSLEGHRGTIVRDRRYRFVGARAETFDDALKAVAMGYDFIIVDPAHFEAVLRDGEPLLPVYVKDVPASELELWQDRGAHGVKP